MFIAANFVIALATVLDYALEIYQWIIIASALVSWVSPNPYNPVVRFLYSVTEPVLRPIRYKIGRVFGPFDISPIIVIFAIIFAQKFIVKSLLEMGYQMKGGLI